MMVTLEEFTADFTREERTKVAARTAQLVEEAANPVQGGAGRRGNK